MKRDDELDEELAAHLRMAAEDRMARGASAEDARDAARREFGNVGFVAESTREAWGGLWRERLLQDLRFGLRTLRRNPGFTVLAVLCLSLGIGANAAVYAWIEGILLRPYPMVAHQERLVVVAGTSRGVAGTNGISWPDFLDLRRQSRLLDFLVLDKITGTTLSIGDRAERVSGQIVSADYFDAIGVRPALGRGFEPVEETGRNAHPVTVISDRLWHRRFHGDSSVIGRTQLLNGVPHTIVGVTPPGFNGTFVGYPIEFFVPASMQETFDLGGYKLDDRGDRWVESMARLKPGVTLEQAQAELQVIAQRLASAYPGTNAGRGIELVPNWRAPFNGAGVLFPTLRVAMLVAFLVLLIACANVGNLLLVRALARRHELTVRLAIGASRKRLVRQLLTEGSLLSLLGAIGGLLVAYWARNLVALLFPLRGVTLNFPATFDWRVLGLSVGVCVLTTLLVGLLPSIQTRGLHLAEALQADAGGVVGGGRSRIRSGLVLLQVSLSFLLLVGTGLLLQSLARMRSTDPGFITSGVTVSAVDLMSAGYDPGRQRIFQDRLLERVRSLPGVQDAALTRIAPFSFRSPTSAPIVVEGRAAAPDERLSPDFIEVTPRYFATLGIGLVEGRAFSDADDSLAPQVAVVNQTMAERYWPGESPVGRFIQLRGRRVEIVGVVRPAKYGTLVEAPRALYYVPLRQHPAGLTVLLIRSTLDRGSIAAALAREIRALDPALAPGTVLTMREQLDGRSSAQSLALSLVGAFGILALLLSGVGLYGVMSCAVSQSTREFGLRMALGADGGRLLRLVLSNGMALMAGGIAIGAATALGTTRLLGDLLYKVSPRDPLAFAAAIIVLAMATSAACLVPAWRAARIDPVRALRP